VGSKTLFHGCAAAKGEAEKVESSVSPSRWISPEQFVEAARRTMGGIDLDPASNVTANEAIKADG
jgi:hypothetical protein